jgi:hypothetical protein
MEPVDVTGDPVTKLRLWWRKVHRFLAWLSAGEVVPKPADGTTGPPHRPLADVAGWLFGEEQLPAAEPWPGGFARTTGSLLGWILSPETLPKTPRRDETDRGSIGSPMRWLLAPERLPIIGNDNLGSGPSVVRWLLASESLPPPIEDAATTRNLEA